jgi:hypothetical protein
VQILSSRWQAPTFSVAQAVSQLVKLYFYLRIVPHALAVLTDLSERFRQSPNLSMGGA